MLPFILVGLTLVVIFYIVPQLSKFRATTGIDKELKSSSVSIIQKIWLMMLGLKTPFLMTVSTVFSFVITESDQLAAFSWTQFMSVEHAAMVSAALWFATLYAHFSGLNSAASIPPVTNVTPVADLKP
jgi:uncharacterized membrane protein